MWSKVLNGVSRILVALTNRDDLLDLDPTSESSDGELIDLVANGNSNDIGDMALDRSPRMLLPGGLHVLHLHLSAQHWAHHRHLHPQL